MNQIKVIEHSKQARLSENVFTQKRSHIIVAPARKHAEMSLFRQSIIPATETNIHFISTKYSL